MLDPFLSHNFEITLKLHFHVFCHLVCTGSHYKALLNM